MKKYLLLTIVSMGLVQFSSAQYQRLVLFEEFTQASCGPCASQNPTFNTLLQANETKTIAIKYQVWWPGFDPMYLQNSPDVDARVGYYAVSGVPHGTMDGAAIENDCGYYTGAPFCADQTEIDDEYAITSPLNIVVTHSFNADYTTIYIHVDVTAGADLSGSLKLQTVVTEKEIDFLTPPGSNGEMEFFGVMKKMLPGATGTTTGDFASGETKSYDFEWDLSNIYNLNQLMVVAFVQDDATKYVIQSGKSDPNTGLPALDYAVNSVSSVSCSNAYEPVVNVSNNSDDAVNELGFTYSVDGGADAVYNWTGTIAANASADITLPEVTLGAGASHDINVKVAGVDVIDLNMVNNNITGDISVLDAVAVSVEQDFQDTDFPPADWAVDNINDGSGWSRASGGAGGYGESTASTKAYFYAISPGAEFDLYLPKMDLATYPSDAILTYDYAKAGYSGYSDQLQILVSDDCGDSWNAVYDVSDPDLMTAGNQTSDWKPGDNDWETEEVDMSDYAGMSDLLIKFHAISGFGNNLYIDNIRLSSTTAIQSIDLYKGISVYPNPATDNFALNINLNETAVVTVSMTDITGKEVKAYQLGSLASGDNTFYINTTDLASGMYQVLVNVGGQIGVEKVMINK
jgi:hypothetical protein